MGETSAARTIMSIHRSRDLGLRRALIGLGIRNAREGTAKRLCRAGYRSLEAVAVAGSSALRQVDDIGAVVADSIVEFFARDDTTATIRALRDAGVNLDVLDEDLPPPATPGDEMPGVGGGALAGHVVVITGTITNPYAEGEKVTRDAFARLLEHLGATVTGSVSNQTTQLICGANVGAAKTAKAETAGVAVVDQAAIWTLLRDAQLA